MRWLERGLAALALGCFAWCGSTLLEAAVWQRRHQTAFAAPFAAPGSPPGAAPFVRHGAAIGELDIPRLGLTAAIVEGDDAAALRVGVGHLPDTPLPWQPGNAALAAHRDTFFRPLKDVRIGDVIRLTTIGGTFEYQVRETLIVNPDDLSVLASSEHQRLTLMTCYPFSFLGSAPQRFVVRAERNDRRAAQPEPGGLQSW